MNTLGKYVFLALALFLIPVVCTATVCTPTGFFRDGINMTAVLINPASPVTGPVDAAGCNVGVYFDNGKGAVQNAEIYGANFFGVLVNGDVNSVSVDVTGSSIHDIGDSPLGGAQHGVAIYYRAYFLAGNASGTISGNTISNYQKGGIVANGQGTSALITDNIVIGQGHISYIAQNGIQIGFGANASVMRNTVSGNSYTGTTTVGSGIVVVGGPFYTLYGFCPDGIDCPYTVGTRIVGNTVVNNDVGIFLTNLAADESAPTTATNVKAVNNIISNDGVYNNYSGFGYQAGVSDVGNNDKIINNNISGAGYTPATSLTAYLVAIDADLSFTNRPKVHANTTP
ncbi:MAG: right-handed parallel beta-helix repeat-containing protein [Acidobacteriia bacterium]|nr:right-handed parallel beta-helix repeat-containing protein [Terriglobia bacterium]